MFLMDALQNTDTFVGVAFITMFMTPFPPRTDTNNGDKFYRRKPTQAVDEKRIGVISLL